MMTSPNGSPSLRPVTRSFDVFFDLRSNKRLSKQSGRSWFETPLCPLLLHNLSNSQIPQCTYPIPHKCTVQNRNVYILLKLVSCGYRKGALWDFFRLVYWKHTALFNGFEIRSHLQLYLGSQHIPLHPGTYWLTRATPIIHQLTSSAGVRPGDGETHDLFR